MPWNERTTMSERKAFIEQAIQVNSNMSQLCRDYGISRKTGYKWLHRYQAEGVAGLAERSRRPKRSQNQTPPEMEREILRLREDHPAWGGRKLRARLQHLGHQTVPSASTITAILRRHNLIDPEETQKRQPYQRFEKDTPNEMWQIDFKGEFSIGEADCFPLTILDDHSRYLLGLFACKNQRRETVEDHLSTVFRRYGLPDSFLCDNGPPWGSIQLEKGRFTRLNVWWIRLGIRILHSRPYHPQTLGKDERLHRSLNTEVIKGNSFYNFGSCQHAFKTWRHVYNNARPHEALALDTPGNFYQKSRRSFPEKLPPIEYDRSMQTRKVNKTGRIAFLGKTARVGRAFSGYFVGILPDELLDGVFHVYFCRQHIKTICIQSEVEC